MENNINFLNELDTTNPLTEELVNKIDFDSSLGKYFYKYCGNDGVFLKAIEYVYSFIKKYSEFYEKIYEKENYFNKSLKNMYIYDEYKSLIKNKYKIYQLNNYIFMDYYDKSEKKNEILKKFLPLFHELGVVYKFDLSIPNDLLKLLCSLYKNNHINKLLCYDADDSYDNDWHDTTFNKLFENINKSDNKEEYVLNNYFKTLIDEHYRHNYGNYENINYENINYLIKIYPTILNKVNEVHIENLFYFNLLRSFKYLHKFDFLNQLKTNNSENSKTSVDLILDQVSEPDIIMNLSHHYKEYNEYNREYITYIFNKLNIKNKDELKILYLKEREKEIEEEKKQKEKEYEDYLNQEDEDEMTEYLFGDNFIPSEYSTSSSFF